MAGITINSNIASLQTQRRLGQSSSALNQSFQRLSSGQRINRASDDAAGLAISDSLNVDRRVYSQGIRNLNDGVSMLDIGEGALSELSNIVIRVKELAEQAANGTFSNRQRAALDTEAQALSKEYLRIAQTAQFNGQKLFDGSIQGISLQGGYGAAGGIQTTLGGTMGTGGLGTKNDFATGSNPYAVALGDLNGDGILDLVSANYSGNSASVLLGIGDGTFQTKSDFTTDSNPEAITLGDLNGDGILDIVTANYGSDTASVLLGNGNGTFKARKDYSISASPSGIALGDLNGDGILDIAAAANGGGNKAVVMLGNGDGSFKLATNYTGTSNPVSIAIGDLDGDGNSDLVTANESGFGVSVFIGNGNGTFKARTDYTAGSVTKYVALGDFNSDGILDIAAANNGSASVSVFIGNGNGTFKAKSDFTTGSSPKSLAVGDMNGDGFIDILTANNGAANISVLLGNGDGTFKAKSDYTTGAAPNTLALGDLNSDGVLDVVSANVSSVASVLLGQTRDGVAPLLSFSLKTQSDAKWSLVQMSGALNRIASHRGQLGSIQSRLNSAVNNNSITVENYAAAESQIRDADVAQEAAYLAKNRILQQAGAAVLAQANREPAIALSLLK